MRIEEFIEARLAEDEAAARKAADFPYDAPSDAPWVSMQLRVRRGVAMTSDEHFARHDPARVLRQVAATRVALSWCLDDDAVVMGPTIRAIAAIWSDHPDYRPEWAV
ncbi:DUF6221 family protein [Nocardia farcinica]|uniref:DUF6221 family protein n=1 Tax=Nocardia farcinica TaxID=37329 RepID=UPI0018939197|nr:DUF6221 family protein [Nocardia farcinica]MBF6573753.1 hypothetical protein [Nocardia farcinica]